MRNLSGIGLLLLLMAQSSRAGDITKDLERGLGKMVAEELESTYGVVDDPLLVGWVDRVGQRLAAVSGRTDVKYRFRVLDSDDVNAVAAPGGFIYVNRGTLRFIQSEDELAAVMGHEVGHVAGKHAMKQLTAQVVGTLAMLGFQAAHVETLRTIGGLAGGLAMLKFSRDEENDADRRGLKNAVLTGYDGRAMLTFFRHLETTEKDKPNGFEVYFMTHPPTKERIRRINQEGGTAESAANLIALGQGLEARSLFRQAAGAYRRALDVNPDDTATKALLADSLRRAPVVISSQPLSPERKTERLRQLASFVEELEQTRQSVANDRRSLADAQKTSEDELESAARSLSGLSQMISRRDTVQIRQFLRLARAFDRATRVGANLRAARELSDSTLGDLQHLCSDIRQAVERGDAEAAGQVDGLLMVGHTILQDLSAGIKQARSHGGDARDGARSLRIAADSLLTSYRSPFGYTSGQFDILDLQVSSAQDSLGGAVASTRRSLGLISRSRTNLLVARINFLTRSIRPDDAAIVGILAHYLGAAPETVADRRAKLEFGDAALAIADETIEEAAGKKKKSDKPSPRTASLGPMDQAVREGLRWENAGVLLNLMAHDLERETAK